MNYANSVFLPRFRYNHTPKSSKDGPTEAIKKKKVVSYEKGGLKKFHEGERKFFFFNFFFTVPNMNASFYFFTFEKNCNLCTDYYYKNAGSIYI